MAWSFIASSTAAGIGTGGLSVAKPAGTTTGDLLLLMVVSVNSGSVISSSGFSLIGVPNNTIPKLYVLAKVAGGSEPANYTVNDNIGLGIQAHILTYRGVAFSSLSFLLEAYAAGSASNGTLTAAAPSYETLRASKYLNICVFAVSSGGGTLTVTGGILTQRSNLISATATLSVAVADIDFERVTGTPYASSANKTASHSFGGPWQAFQLMIRDQTDGTEKDVPLVRDPISLADFPMVVRDLSRDASTMDSLPCVERVPGRVALTMEALPASLVMQAVSANGIIPIEEG
jgi:hypothetical protein